MFLAEEDRKTEDGPVMEERADKDLEQKTVCQLCSEEGDKVEKTTKVCSCQRESSASSEDSVLSSDKVGLTSVQWLRGFLTELF